MTAGGIPGVADVYPLSPSQAGMVFHTLAEPGAGVYLVQAVYELDGPVPTEVLGGAMQRLVDHHPMLRTAFVWEGLGKPVQVVHEPGPAAVAVLDWADRPEGSLAEFLAADRARGLELGPAPAFRAAIVRTAPERHAVVWTFHHALLDGWSAELLLGELLETCEAAAAGREAAPGERRPFKDFIAWLGTRDEAAAQSFWSGELAGFTTPTSIRPEAPVTTATEHRTVVREAPADLTSRLLAFARAHRLTPSTVVQGAWSLLLSRYAGHDDVVFGVTTSGRPAALAGVEGMVGMFLVTVPTRVRIDDEAAVVSWLAELQAAGLRRAEHEHSPLVDIQRWSALPPGVALFDSILVYENVPRHRNRGAVAVHATQYLDNSNYPLALIVSPRDRLTFKVLVDPKAYSAGTVDRLLDHLVTLLQAIVEDPEAPLGSLSMLSEAELARLSAWNDTAVEYDDDRLVHQLIDAWAGSTPDALAVADGGETLTYAELAGRSDALAGELVRRGVRPNTFVGVHLERSADTIVAIVGVLKAGGAYLPLDPAYPTERLGFMLDDAGVDVLVTTTSSLADLPGQWTAAATLGGGLTVAGAAAPEPAERREPLPSDLAYMIYTSGSTGVPNGVPIEHAQLLHSTQARFEYYDDQPGAFLLLSPFSFDSSVVGIFWTLAAGGLLVLPGPGEELDVQALARLVDRHQVTHTLCLPSLYRLLVEHADPARLASLRTVIVAGEACPPDLPAQHRRALPGATLYNEYGPTEAAVWCTVHRCDPAASGPVPIGRPIANTQIAVLDRRFRPVPVDAPGEIYVGGSGVAGGYHKRAELTSARFVELPAAGLPVTPGAEGSIRLFRTGDVGSYRADGALEYLGRADDQVKVRGFRVELGEIEAALRRHGEVAECAVVAVDDGAGKHLVAYVEHGAGAAATAEELQRFLRATLPEHMVPRAVIAVAALPRLPNGKIDRSTLRAADRGLASDGRPVLPRDDLERRLAAIWAELLPGVTIGIHDDFFEIGGHSILAVALVEKIRRGTGKEVRLAALLKAPTVASQAALLRDDQPADNGSSVVAVKPEGSRPPLYMVPAAGSTSLVFHGLAGRLSPDQPLFAFEPLGTDGITAPQRSIPEMASRYVADLRSHQPAGPYRIGGTCMGAHVAWEMASQLQRLGETVETLVVIDAAAPDNGPGWTSPPRRESHRPIRSGIRHLFTGSLGAVARHRWRVRRSNRRFQGMHRAHLAAQSSYEASPLDVDVFLVQSADYAHQPEIGQRWRALAGDRLMQVTMPDVKHREMHERVGATAGIVDRHLERLGAPERPS